MSPTGFVAVPPPGPAIPVTPMPPALPAPRPAPAPPPVELLAHPLLRAGCGDAHMDLARAGQETDAGSLGAQEVVYPLLHLRFHQPADLDGPRANPPGRRRRLEQHRQDPR